MARDPGAASARGHTARSRRNGHVLSTADGISGPLVSVRYSLSPSSSAWEKPGQSIAAKPFERQERPHATSAPRARSPSRRAARAYPQSVDHGARRPNLHGSSTCPRSPDRSACRQAAEAVRRPTRVVIWRPKDASASHHPSRCLCRLSGARASQWSSSWSLLIHSGVLKGCWSRAHAGDRAAQSFGHGENLGGTWSRCRSIAITRARGMTDRGPGASDAVCPVHGGGVSTTPTRQRLIGRLCRVYRYLRS